MAGHNRIPDQLGSLDPWRANYLTQCKPSQACSHYVLGRHARNGLEIESLPLVELGGNHAGTKRLHANSLRLEFFV